MPRVKKRSHSSVGIFSIWRSHTHRLQVLDRTIMSLICYQESCRKLYHSCLAGIEKGQPHRGKDCFLVLADFSRITVIDVVWLIDGERQWAPYRRNQKANINGERHIICFYQEQKKNISPKTGVEPMSLLFTELIIMIDVCAGRPQKSLTHCLWCVNVLLTST